MNDDITPLIPAPILGIADFLGDLMVAAVLFVATMAALFIFIKPANEKGGAALSYAAAVLLSAVVSAFRADWAILVYAVLLLPAFFVIRWLLRRITTR
ncbi:MULTISPECIES: hypothetical protein [unclassified Microbacterium]|uniref:hypothetical protein n=1 Tax=unclassified Microbacterium TaxID=2609290 RepID=UPI000EA968D8|nr:MULTISPECIES: hypothetical protein [unclassified Microbacterium]MBT2486931.1 hypothetical protein [Microbacterium sp. ISL-108]RKN64334.1 hypothetical protein D7252_19745 [Microbacterium sp. CGR2]